jgi:hypothetical protein
MKKNFLKLLFMVLLSGVAHLNAQTTYYFTGVTDNNYGTHNNWNSERNGTGSPPPTGTTIEKIPDAIFVLQKSARDTVVSTTYQGYYSPFIIEEGANLKFSKGGIEGTVYVMSTLPPVIIEKGGTLITPSYITLYSGAVLTIGGKVEAMYIQANNTSGNIRTVDVQKDAELTLTSTTSSFNKADSIRLINNGTITAVTGGSVNSIEGDGTLNLAGSLTVMDLEASTFLQSGGGTVIYSGTGGTIVLVSQYNNLVIPAEADRTLSGNASVYGNLTADGSKVVTSETLTVSGNVSATGLQEGSTLNVTMNGTTQNIEGVFTRLEIAAGTTATMTGDLTVEDLVLVGTLLNPDIYQLTVTNQTGIEAYKTQLQVAISGVSLYAETDYTLESWATLATAVSAAQALLAEEAEPTTVQLEAAKNAVTAAIAALVTNLSVLENLVNTVRAAYNNSSVYTSETYTALQDSIDAVETFLQDKTAITPTELDAHRTAINSAIANLVREIYTFYLRGGSANVLGNWNTERDGTGITPVDFAAGNTYIAQAGVEVSGLPAFYDSHLIFEASETPATDRQNPVLNGGSLTVQSGRTLVNLNTSLAAFTGSGGTIIVDEGGSIGNSLFSNPFRMEVNGELELRAWTEYGQNPVNLIESLAGTGTVIAKNVLTLSDAASSTFLQSGGGTLIYHIADSLLPSYNHVTIEELTAVGGFVREVESAYPAIPVYGNLLLRNNQRRVTISNPLTVAGDFTVDYDIEDESVVQATIAVSGNVSLSGLLAEDNSLNVTLTGTEQELTGAGFTQLTVSLETTATLTGNLTVEETLTVNGVLDRNGYTIRFDERAGNGVVTDSRLAAALQDSIDNAEASYPDGNIYTAESWTALQEALSAAEALIDDETPDEITVLEAAIADVAAAIAGLERATAIHNVEADGWKLGTSKSSLLITGDAEVKVYNIAGRQLYSGRVNGETIIPLPAGVYIVTVNGKASKTVVR